jgi:hypothetical protein
MHSSNTALHALYHLMACPIIPRYNERDVHPLLKSEVPLLVKGNVEAVVPLTVPLTLPLKKITPYCKGPIEAFLVRGRGKGYIRGYCP